MEIPIEKETTIEAYKDPSSLGIILMHDDDINAITDNTGTLADANEYQVHYHFLNGRFTFEDNSLIDVAIPVCYFNYKQEVSAASVDFHLKDVDDRSTLLAPVANAKVNALLATDITDKFKSALPGVDFEWLSVNLGTIHKHPGALDSFSGTDLSTSMKNPGICFPLGSIEEGFIKPSFSSIILHKGDRSVIGHSEYRLALEEDSTVKYYKGRCITLVHGNPIKPSKVEELLGVPIIETSYSTKDNVTSLPIFTEILKNCFKALDFKASTEFTTSDNVAKKVHATAINAYKHKTTSTYTPKKTVPHHTTKAYKDVAELIFKEHNLQLMQYHELAALPHMEVVDHFNAVEEAASYVPTIHTFFTPTTIRDIIAMQNELWLETDEFNEEVMEDYYNTAFFVN